MGQWTGVVSCAYGELAGHMGCVSLYWREYNRESVIECLLDGIVTPSKPLAGYYIYKCVPFIDMPFLFSSNTTTGGQPGPYILT